MCSISGPPPAPQNLAGSSCDHPGAAVSLFSGAGGLDLGVEAAGLRPCAAVEVNNDAADTMEKNFLLPWSPVIRGSSWTVLTPGSCCGLPGCRPRAPGPAGRWAAVHSRSPSPGSGWTGSAPGSTPMPASSRPTPGCWPRPGPGFHPRERVRPDLSEQGQPAGLSSAAGRDRRGRLPLPLGRPQCRRLRRAPAAAPAVRRRRAEGHYPARAARADPRRSVGASPTGDRTAACHGRRGASRAWSDSPSQRRWSAVPGATSCPRSRRVRTTSTTPPSGAPRPCLRVAEPLLVVPAEAGPRSTIADHPGTAGPERRAVPLGQPPAPGPGASTALHLPRRLRLRRQAGLGPGQIGNSVPPLLAQQVARYLAAAIS